MKNYSLAILGCGNMAQAIIRALSSEKAKADFAAQNIRPEIIVSDLDESKLAAVSGLAETTQDNVYAVSRADYILLAVKPQSAPAMLEKLNLADKTVISIMAGVTLDTLEKLAASKKTVRVMPNLNARVYKSFNAYAHKGLGKDELEFTKLLLGSFGTAAEVKESELNAVTGLTGSSPAFVFMFLKSFIDTGVSLGFCASEAREMALAAVIGSAELVKASEGADLDDMINSVCSKGGTTIEGVKHLREKEFEKITSDAIIKAVERAKELGAAK